MTTLPTPDLKPGDYFVSRMNGLVGVLVRIGQALAGDWSRYSHAGVYLGDGLVIEAQPGCAQIISLDELRARKGPIAWSQNPLTGEQRESIVEKARAYEGRKYGWASYLAIAADALHVKTPLLDKFIINSPALICSQLVDEVYLRTDIHLFDDGRIPGKVSPGDLTYVGLICHEPGR